MMLKMFGDLAHTLEARAMEHGLVLLPSAPTLPVPSAAGAGRGGAQGEEGGSPQLLAAARPPKCATPERSDNTRWFVVFIAPASVIIVPARVCLCVCVSVRVRVCLCGVSVRVCVCLCVSGFTALVRRRGQEYCMDLIAEVAAAEEIQLAQIQQAHAAAAAVGAGSETRPGHSASGPTGPMGVAVGSELSTEVRVFVFAWADPPV